MPERLDAGPVVLRRGRRTDATALAEAVGQSLDHLSPWLSWATPPAATVAVQRARIRDARRAWRAGNDYAYLVFLPAGDRPIGGIGLHRRIGPGALEIGYWIHVDHAGQGKTTAAVRALTEAALRLADVSRLEIHCDVANDASAAVPAKVGYRLDRIDPHPPLAPSETGHRQIWVFPPGD